MNDNDNLKPAQPSVWPALAAWVGVLALMWVGIAVTAVTHPLAFLAVIVIITAYLAS